MSGVVTRSSHGAAHFAARYMVRGAHAFILCLILIALLPGLMPRASAATISNTAELRYRLAGNDLAVLSNTISFETVPLRTAATVGFLRAINGSAGAQLPQDAGQCRRADGAFTPIELPQSGIALNAQSLQPALTFMPGEMVYLTLSDADQNSDPSAIDTVDVTVTSSSGDTEVVRLFESGPDTGEFLAVLPTHSAPPLTGNDCRLHLVSGALLAVTYVDPSSTNDIARAELLVDPFGIVFDSLDGAPVDGVSVTIIDDLTGLPAQVFGEDGTSSYPSTVITGAVVIDGAGVTYAAFPGAYRFPFVVPGRYRLLIQPPPGYRAPSGALPAALQQLTAPGGGSFEIGDGSFGLPFNLAGPQPLRLDLPIDRADRTIVLEKLASATIVESGDFVHYRFRIENRAPVATGAFSIVDDLPAGFRFKAGSVRSSGGSVDAVVADSGNRVTFHVGAAPASGSIEIGYTLVVGPAARPGEAVNRAVATNGTFPLSNEAVASVSVRPPFLTDAATIIGRISEGRCGIADGERPGVAGVRLLLEDGTYVVSDRDGRYHFEGVSPGLHVVQVDLGSLPPGYTLAGCFRNSRHAGRNFSTFVDVSGGALWRADFVLEKTQTEHPATSPETTSGPAATRPSAVADAAAAGAGTDWLAGQKPGTAILFPDDGHNPRAPAQRLVVKHSPGTNVKAMVNGVAASPLAFDGVLGNAAAGVLVSRWRALPLNEGRNTLTAEIRDAAGTLVDTLTRDVWFTSNAARAVLVPERSALIADGRARPVVAVRLTDAAGRPIRGGSSGSFSVSAPYVAAAEVDAQQERQLAGLDARPTEWRVEGDDGIAYIELAPTTQTGTLTLGFTFQADRTRYAQTLEAWLSPGETDWIVVGYAAGTTGFNTLADKTKLLDRNAGDTFTDGEVKFFAKGRILGKWLMTLAYDEGRKARRPGEARQLLRTIDPDRYYTVYGDGSEQRYDAPTSDKLYLRLERAQFYALYGDFETGLTRTELTRYSRTLTGAKAEYRSDRVAVNAFAADTGLGFARDEIQGNGLSGPYRLSRRNIVLNSEKIHIEIRDRFRSEIVISRTPQTRNVDYDFDAPSASVRFRAPVASRDPDLNLQFIVVDYETEGTAKQYLNAGGRAAVRLADGRIEAGASFIRDADNTSRTNVGGIDIRIQPRPDTEVRLEAAFSDRSGAAPVNARAYIAEVEHHGEDFDFLGYFRQQDAGFGVGQQNASQGGTRKYGAEGSFRMSDALRLSANAYREDNLVGPANRSVADIRSEYRNGETALRGGFRFVRDHNQLDETRKSELLTLGASQDFLGRKLVLDADAEVALAAGKDASVDFPSRYRVGARYALTSDVRIILTHEIADGDTFSAQTTALGFDIVPWRGSRIATTLNQRAIGENGRRTFAALGLTQSLLINERWGLDAAFDSNTTFDGAIRPEDVLDRNQPVANGTALLNEDFWALSLGATYRTSLLSWNGRVEYRNGSEGDRYGITTAVLRQTEDGVSLAASSELFRVRTTDAVSGSSSSGTSGLIRLSGAYRPAYSQWSVLDRLDISLEDLRGGALPGPFGFSPGVGGKSRRVVNNLALNHVSGSGITLNGFAHDQRAQMSLYWGVKYVLDRFDGEDFGGFAQVAGLDIRHDFGSKFDIGASASVHHVATGGQVSYAIGPNVGMSPFTNAWVSFGYNVAGYHDRDFEESRYTRKGSYVTFRLKLDQMTPEAVFSNLR